jgi:hypothetical protein
MAFMFGIDPADDDKRMLCCVKANIRAKPKAIQFIMDTEEMPRVGPVPRLLYDDEVEFDAMRLFDGRARKGVVGRPADKRHQAAEWLTAYLVDAGKPVAVKKIREDAKQYGMSTKTLQRAADDMKVKRIPPGGGPKVKWDLSDDIKKMLADDDDEAIEAKAKQLAKDIEKSPVPPEQKGKPTELDDFLTKLLEEDEASTRANDGFDALEDQLKKDMGDAADKTDS